MRDVTLEQEELTEESIATTEEVQPPEENVLGEEWPAERPSERIMGAQASQVALALMAFVQQHVSERKLGKVFGPDGGYQLPTEAGKVRYPDGSFIARGRLPDERTPSGHLLLPPDLAVEVVSPHNSAYEVEEKRVVYLKAGVRLLWIVYPPTRTVFVFRASGSVAVLGEADTLTGEDVLPDFTCPIARFFEDL